MMFANSREQKNGVGVKWGAPSVRDSLHTDYGPRFEDKSHLFGAQKTEHETVQSSRHLWVGNVSQHVSETALAEQFSRFGELESLTVYSSRNYAFINFRKEEDAVIAKRSLQGLILGGLALRIEFAKGDAHVSSVHRAEEHLRLRDDRHSSEVTDFSGLRDAKVPGPNHIAPSSDKAKGDKDAEPSEVLWIGFPAYIKVDEMSLRRVFSPFGEIEHITTFPGRTYAFVQFQSVVEACRAKEALQGKLFNNPRVNICFSKSEVGPVEHGRTSVNGTSPFSHKAVAYPGVSLKDVDRHRQDRNHVITSVGLCMPSPTFGSNPERMQSDPNVKLGRASSVRTMSAGSNIGVGYDQRRLTRQGSEMGGKKEATELSMNSPRVDRSAFWRANALDKSHGGNACFEDIWDSPADERSNREVKRPRVAAVPGNDPSGSPFFDQGRESHHFPLPRTGAVNPVSEGYKPSRFPIGGDGDSGISHQSVSFIPENARRLTRQSQHRDGPWHVRDNFESGVASSTSSLNSVKWDGCVSDVHHGPLNDEWKWQGTIAKGGTPVCRARCFPVGKVLDVTLPEFLNCTARTGLDMLAKHFYQAGSVGVVFFVPESDPDIIPYNEFMHYLGEKQRAAVTKLGEGITLFLVPPSEFSEQVLKVPGKVSISGVILKFQQINASYGPPHQPPSEVISAQPKSFLQRASLTSAPPMHEDSTYPKPSSPLAQPRYSGQGNTGFYSEHFQSSSASFSSLQSLLPAGAGPTGYQGHGSGASPSASTFGGGTVSAAVVNENRSHHLSPQNQASASTWSSLNQEQFHALNSRSGTFVSPSSSLLSSQSEFASTQQSLTVQQQQSCIPATNSGQQHMGAPNNPCIGGPIIQSQQQPRSLHPTSLSIPHLQPDHLTQLANLLGHQQQSVQLPVTPLLQENQLQPIHPNSQAMQNFSSVSQVNLQAQATASVQAPSSQFSYGQQLQQHPSQPAALPRGGPVNDTLAPQCHTINQPDNQMQTDGREECEADPQKRLQATLQLAAALLQQIQQQARTVDQQ